MPFDTLGAIKFSNQAQFNPCKYANGIISKIENKIQIYENTKVVDIEKKDEIYKIITEEGNKIIAKHVVLASHYPIINAPGYYFLKMYQSMSYVIGVEVDEKLFDGMYISSDQPPLSFRTAKYGDKNLLIVAGMDHKTGEKRDISGAYEALERVADEFYPDGKVLYRWSTEDCIPLDKIPYIGEFSIFWPNVYVATGFKKWGITTSNVAANIIVDKILGKENIYQDVFESKRLKPIKNHVELANMIKESVKSLVIEKIKPNDDKISELGKGEGQIVEIDGQKVGVYKDENGKIFAVKPICTHLGCELSWNDLEKTWDCPCHGSRFSYEGKSIYAPSIKDLETINIDI